MSTAQLIAALSADAASRPKRVGRPFAVALVCGTAAVAALFGLRLGVRPDVADALATLRFPFKFVLTTVLAATAAALVLRLAKPGGSAGAAGLAVVAAPLLLLAAVAVEIVAVPEAQWRARTIGSMSMVCLMNIPLLAAAPLAGLLFALRRGAPASPALSGAVAGLLAGALAATFYAASCLDDSPLFVAVWYTLAIGLVSVAGAIAGARVLRW